MNLFLSTVIDGTGEGAAAATTATTEAAATSSMSPTLIMVLYLVAIFGAMYFLSIRPQKKRQAKMEEMRKGIQVGDSVLLANGMFGKVADVTAECYIIEFGTNKGVRIPVIKQEVYAKKEPNLSNKVEEEPAPVKKSLFGKKAEQKES